MLVSWARGRFDIDLQIDDLRNKQREEIRSMLVGHSRQHREKAEQTLSEVHHKVDQLFEAISSGDSSLDDTPLANIVGGNGKLDSLSHWAHETLNYDIEPGELAQLDRNQLELRLITAVENIYRPEMRKMERALVLQIVDSAWKEHLLSMDPRTARAMGLYAKADTLAAEIESLEGKLSETETHRPESFGAAELKESARREFDDLKSVIGSGTVEEKRALIAEYVHRVDVEPERHTVRISLYPPGLSQMVAGVGFEPTTFGL